MRVLIACESSGIVRDAFAARGHYAMSCDLLPTERPGEHYQCDVRDVLDYGWDMVIAHPPCTDLAVSGARYFAQKRADGRQQASVDFFMLFANCQCPKVAIENPVGIMSRLYRKPDQIIQPWMFGHNASKSTCLWLKELPLLEATQVVPPSYYICKCGAHFDGERGKYGCPNCNGGFNGPARPVYGNQTPSGQNKLGPSPDRWKERSRTYEGIAIGMASQWK